jgi:hypothetical protein
MQQVYASAMCRALDGTSARVPEDGGGRVFDFTDAAEGEARNPQLILECTQPVTLDRSEWQKVYGTWLEFMEQTKKATEQPSAGK